MNNFCVNCGITKKNFIFEIEENVFCCSKKCFKEFEKTKLEEFKEKFELIKKKNPIQDHEIKIQFLKTKILYEQINNLIIIKKLINQI